MRKMPVALLVAAFALAVAASTSIAAERTPAGSFLKYRVTSVGQLSGQIAKDTTARVRYAQHFGVSPDEVNSYFAKNLKLTSLQSPLKVRTYYVGKDGRVYKKTKLYPKGTMVFSTKEGKPVLAWSCGNPLSTALPIQKPKVAAVPGGSVETKVLANPVETVTAAAITAPPAPEVIAVTPVAAPPPVAAMAAPPVAVPPPLGAKFPIFWLPMLFAGDGDHDDPPPPPVPEPGSLVIIATGLAGVAGLRRSRGHH